MKRNNKKHQVSPERQFCELLVILLSPTGQRSPDYIDPGVLVPVCIWSDVIKTLSTLKTKYYHVQD